ncbi:hypothetical protein FG93_00038 [Bosea sp. LC85]|nr:hypothetical protein [Bosea sp. LC85]KFC75898.1 hypothetical protein FG93_00038 [Bosea sp. LC85]
MLDRHDSDCVVETEREPRNDHEEQQDETDFSPRAYQEGFWS